jgi:hypothetical protein
VVKGDEVLKRLDGALRAAGIPIRGVSIGRADDSSTWTAQYDPSATKDQIAAGDALIAAFDPEATEVVDAVNAVEAEAMASSRMIRAFYLWWFRKTNRRDPTDDERTADIAALVQAYKDVR